MYRTLFILPVVCFSLLFGVTVSAQTSGDDSNSTRSRRIGSGLVLPELDTEATPWTDRPVLEDPDRFQIAIMTDRTGGHRAGVWSQGLRAINLLRPAFVVSVGDLIEGYTENTDVIENEWDDFLKMMEPLKMKFFFVAGNHDLTNPVMHPIWRRRFGKEWYSFDYKGVHFVCLNTEDAKSEIGEEQRAWLRKDLKEHADARWTLVFLHRPLWVYAERARVAGYPITNGWPEIESMLVDRPHTVFAGHTHHYVQFQRNGQHYYQLATTGGGSQLRGQAYGEFDHITWLTMEQDGPHVANLKLDGVLAADVATEESVGRFNQYLRSARIEVSPVLMEEGANALQEGSFDLHLANHFDEPVELDAEITGLPLQGLSMDRKRLQLACAPGESKTMTVQFAFRGSVPVEQLIRTSLQAGVRSTGADKLFFEATRPVVMDQLHPLAAAPVSVAVDGDLSEWAAILPATTPDSIRLGHRSQWKGQTDGSMAQQIGGTTDTLYFAFDVTDDLVVPGEDGVTICLDSRAREERQSAPEYGDAAFLLQARMTSGDEVQVKLTGPGSDTTVQQVEAVSRRRNGGYTLELRLPRPLLQVHQGEGWKDFQYTTILEDVDNPGDEPCWILWRGTRNYRRRNSGFAYIVRP